MEWLTQLLPATVIAAIVLFLVKETVESVRRWRADARKGRAFRVLLARECELNNWACRRLKETLITIKGDFDEKNAVQYAIKRLKSGEVVFRWASEATWGEWPLPDARVDLMSKLMLDVASLDQALFIVLEAAHDSVIELRHVREGLIRHIESEDEHQKNFFEAFPEYGLGEIDDILEHLNTLYQECTGKPLEAVRLR